MKSRLPWKPKQRVQNDPSAKYCQILRTISNYGKMFSKAQTVLTLVSASCISAIHFKYTDRQIDKRLSPHRERCSDDEIQYSWRHTYTQTNTYFIWSPSKQLLLMALGISCGCEAGCKGQVFHVSLTQNSLSICHWVIKIRGHQEDSQFPSDTSSQYTHMHVGTHARTHLHLSHLYKHRQTKWTNRF